MRKISSLLFALGIGVTVEVMLCGVAVVSIFAGGFGPCGPSGDFPSWLVFVHQPGVWVARGMLPDGTFSRLPIIVVTTVLLLSVAAYIAILIGWRLCERESQTSSTERLH